MRKSAKEKGYLGPRHLWEEEEQERHGFYCAGCLFFLWGCGGPT